MRKYFIAIITLVLFSVPSLSAAADRPGPYFSLFLGSSFASDVTVTTFDFFNNNSFSDRVTFDPGIYTGGTGGYDFGFLRLEGELAFRSANIDTITESTGNRFRNVDGDIGAFSSMFNVFFDMHNPSRVTPYLGGGIGFATLHLSDTFGFNTTTGNRELLYGDSDDTVFAYQVGAGVDVAINSRLSLDLGYRYFGTDKARFDSDFDTTSELRFESHNALVGVKFKF